MKNKIDNDVKYILKTIDDIAKHEKISYFIAGATARDIMFWNMHNKDAAK